MDATTITRPEAITAIDLLFETWEYLFQQDPQVLKRGVRLPGALALEHVPHATVTEKRDT